MARIINFGVPGFGGRRGQLLSLDTGAPIVPVPGIQRTSTPQSVDEDGSDITVSFRLRTQPANPVSVVISTSDSGALALGDQVLRTFTTSNWDMAQSLTLDPIDDTDFADESVTITLTASSTDTDYHGLTSTFVVTVVDVDVPPMGITRTVTPSAVTEPGTTTVSFHLASQPSGIVTVEGSTDDSSSLTFSPSSFVTFSTTDWNTAKSLTLSAVADVDADDETVAVTLTAGTNYGSVTSTFNVTVTDDDAAGAISLTSNATALTEGGSNGTVVFSLSAQPTETVTVTGSISDTDAVAFVGATSRDFTTSNWNSTQTLTYGAVDDTDSDNESVTLTLTASGAQYDSVTSSYTVTVTDDDTAATKTLVITSLLSTITEGGGADVFNIQLSEEPTGDVLVTVSSGDTDALTIRNDSIFANSRTYTTGNWDTDRLFQMNTVQDSDSDNESVTLTFTVTGGGFASASTTRTIAITDDDSVTPVMWMTGASPSALFTLNPSTGVATQVGSATNFGGDVTNPNSLFWHPTQSKLYLTDNTDEALYSVDIGTGVSTRIGSATAFGVTPSPDAVTGLAYHGTTAYMVDNDQDSLYTLNISTGVAALVGSVRVGDGNENQPRGLASDGTTMYLAGRQNDALFTVDVSDGSVTEIGDFLDTDGNTLLNIDGMSFHEGVLYAVNDAGGDNSLYSVNVTSGQCTSIGSVTNFDGEQSAPKGLASNQVLQAASGSGFMGFVPTNLPSTIAEGSTATFNVKLDASPTEGNSVSVTVASRNSNVMTVTGGASLTFDTSNWDTAQDVTLTGTGGGGGLRSQILLSASGGGFDDNVMQFFPKVTPIDDSIIATGSRRKVGEGNTGNFQVKLSSQPTSTVTVTAVSGDTSTLYITAGSSLTFTTSNWDTFKGVDVYGVEDVDSAHEGADVTLTASGGGNSATAVRTIRVYDDD